MRRSLGSLVALVIGSLIVTDAAAQSGDSLTIQKIRLLAEPEIQARHESRGGVVPRPTLGALAVERADFGIRVEGWRVIPRFSHDTPLLVARVDDRLLRLAGFESPELFELDRLTRPAVRDSAAVVAAARVYSVLTDPKAGQGTTACAGSSVGVFRERDVASAERMPEGWWAVRIRSCFMDRTRAEAQEELLVFRFDETGALIGWHRSGRP